MSTAKHCKTAMVLARNPAQRDGWQRTLRSMGVKVLRGASQGQAAFQTAAEEKDGLDLLVTELVLDDVNALQFFSALRKVPKFARTYFVLILQEEEAPNIKTALSFGLTEFLFAPVSADRLARQLDATFALLSLLQGNATALYHHTAGRFFEREREYDLARQEFDKTMVLQPNPMVALDRARMTAFLGKREEAEREIEQIAVQNPKLKPRTDAVLQEIRTQITLLDDPRDGERARQLLGVPADGLGDQYLGHGRFKRGLVVAGSMQDGVGLRSLLASVGAGSTEILTSGKDTMAHLAAKPTDLVVIEMELRDMNGLQLVQLIRSKPKHERTMILVCMEESFLVNLPRAFDLGADGFLLKPISGQSLRAGIHQMMTWRALGQGSGAARASTRAAAAFFELRDFQKCIDLAEGACSADEQNGLAAIYWALGTHALEGQEAAKSLYGRAQILAPELGPAIQRMQDQVEAARPRKKVIAQAVAAEASNPLADAAQANRDPSADEEHQEAGELGDEPRDEAAPASRQADLGDADEDILGDDLKSDDLGGPSAASSIEPAIALPDFSPDFDLALAPSATTEDLPTARIELAREERRISEVAPVIEDAATSPSLPRPSGPEVAPASTAPSGLRGPVGPIVPMPPVAEAAKLQGRVICDLGADTPPRGLLDYLSAVGGVFAKMEISKEFETAGQPLPKEAVKALKRAARASDPTLALADAGKALVRSGHVEELFRRIEIVTQQGVAGAGSAPRSDGPGVEGDVFARHSLLAGAAVKLAAPMAALNQEYQEGRKKFDALLPEALAHFVAGNDRDPFQPLYQAIQADHQSLGGYKKIFIGLAKQGKGELMKRFFDKNSPYFVRDDALRRELGEYVLAKVKASPAGQSIVEVMHRADPKDSKIVTHLALSSFKMGDLEETMKWCSRLLKIDAASETAYNLIGVVYKRQKKTKKAIKYYSKGLKLNPKSIKLHHNLALAYLEAGQKDKSAASMATVEFLKKEKGLETAKAAA